MLVLIFLMCLNGIKNMNRNVTMNGLKFVDTNTLTFLVYKVYFLNFLLFKKHLKKIIVLKLQKLIKLTYFTINPMLIYIQRR